jgi:hypothetical protein
LSARHPRGQRLYAVIHTGNLLYTGIVRKSAKRPAVKIRQF